MSKDLHLSAVFGEVNRDALLRWCWGGGSSEQEAEIGRASSFVDDRVGLCSPVIGA